MKFEKLINEIWYYTTYIGILIIFAALIGFAIATYMSIILR